MGIWRLWKTLAIAYVISKFSLAAENENPDIIERSNEKLSIMKMDNNKFTQTANSQKLNSKTDKSKESIEEFIESAQPHSRKKRLIWVTDDGRLALPPGTTLSISPTIALPLVRHPPEGFLSNLTISFPLTIDFDKLGLTDNQNPLGELPPIFARSFGRAAGRMLGSYVSQYLESRQKRDLLKVNEPKNKNSNFKVNFVPHDNDDIPVLPENYKHIFHGGERALLYGVIEDLLSTFGMDGRACLLRTICEVHSKSLEHLGFFGETIKLFLTATKSPFAEHIPEYVKAQRIGEGTFGPGECFPYYKDCPKSIFKSSDKYKYRENTFEENNASDVIDNEIYSNVLKSSDNTIRNIPGGILSM